MAYNSGIRQVYDESGKPKDMGDIKKNPNPPTFAEEVLKNSKVDLKNVQKAKDAYAKKEAERLAAEKAKRAADAAAKAEATRIAKAKADKLIAEQRKKDEEAALALKNAGNETYTSEERNTTIGRQKQKMIGEYGRSDTILTGPLGIANGPGSKAKKTLLGI